MLIGSSLTMLRSQELIKIDIALVALVEQRCYGMIKWCRIDTIEQDDLWNIGMKKTIVIHSAILVM